MLYTTHQYKFRILHSKYSRKRIDRSRITYVYYYILIVILDSLAGAILLSVVVGINCSRKTRGSILYMYSRWFTIAEGHTIDPSSLSIQPPFNKGDKLKLSTY